MGNHPYYCVTIITISLGFNGASTLTNLQNSQDLAPNFAGTLYGIINFFGTTTGFLTPMVVAHFTQERVRFSSGFNYCIHRSFYMPIDFRFLFPLLEYYRRMEHNLYHCRCGLYCAGHCVHPLRQRQCTEMERTKEGWIDERCAASDAILKLTINSNNATARYSST